MLEVEKHGLPALDENQIRRVTSTSVT